MYVRLAFAVAAHLEPEILIVDEVLAVGDMEFQKKCLGKMEDVSKGHGRTVLFVSHNMDTVKKLCNRGVLLKNGELHLESDINSVIDEYLRKGSSFHFERAPMELRKPMITDLNIDPEKLKMGVLNVKINFKSPFKLIKPNVGIVLYNLFGVPLFGTNSKLHNARNHFDMHSGQAELTVDLPLHSDSYKISVFLGDSQVDYDSIEDVLSFDFISPNYVVNIYDTKSIGALNLSPTWEYFIQ